VHLRGTWGTSFKAPSFLDEYGQTQLVAYRATYWGVTTPNAVILVQAGSNPALKPETSRAWTLGSDYAPSSIPGLKVSATYYDLNYKGRITTPLAADLTQALNKPIYAPYVTYAPSAALQAQLISEAQSYSNYSGHAYVPSDVVALVNNAYQNVAREEVSGVDLNIDYAWQTDFGDFDFGADGSWMKFEQMLLPTIPKATLSGTIFNPPNWKGRLNASWTKDNWVVSAAANHIDGEINNTVGLSNGNGIVGVPERIAAWTTVDIQIAYHSSAESGPLHGIRLALSVQNLFDQDPPFIDPTSTIEQGIGFDSTNASPVGRFISISLTKDW
jgi:outer membrane receptor protein involved in Fe transport